MFKFRITTFLSALFTVIPPRSPLGPIHADIKPNVVIIRGGGIAIVTGVFVVFVVGGELPAVPVGRAPDGQGEAGMQFNGFGISWPFWFLMKLYLDNRTRISDAILIL